MRWIAAAAVVGLAAGIAIAWFTRPGHAPPDPETPAAAVGDPRPPFRHAAIDGRIVEADDFDGRWLLLNFWATWCAPCVREMPVLQAVDEDYRADLSVVGIAVDEPGAIRPFVERLGVTYPILIGTSDVRETRDRYGNPDGLLPYTVLVDRRGTIRWRHLGELERPEIDRALDRFGFPGG